MLLGEIHHDSVPLPPETEHMNSSERVEDPPRRGVLHRLACLVGKRRVMRLQGGTNALRQRGIHQPTHGHAHAQRHDALGLVQIARGGEKLRVLQKSASAFRRHLACIAFQHRWRRQVGGVERMRGQDDTTLLVNEGLAGSEGRGPGPVDVVDHLVGWCPLSGASPCAIAGQRAHRARAQNRGLQIRLEGPTCLTGLRFTRTGGTASVLNGFDCLGTRPAPRLVDGALCWRLAGLGGHQEPALLHATVGRRQLVSTRALVA